MDIVDDGFVLEAPVGWTTIIVTRPRIAIAASTNEMPYAGA